MTPTSRDLSTARDLFRHLLARQTAEREWQSFFTDHPYVLSRSLPLKLEPADILPLGRPGRAEPDFAFYPKGVHPIPYYGVIELKRPDSHIASLTRSNVAILSRDAETAVQQAMQYIKPPHTFLPEQLNERPLFLGNNAYMFVIMGMSWEIGSRIGADICRDMIERRLPENLQLLPYDILLNRYEAGFEPRVYFLFAMQSVQEARSDVSKGAPYEVHGDDCILDEHGNCINPNMKHWGANE